MTKITLIKYTLIAVTLLIGLNGYSRNVNDYRNAVGIKISTQINNTQSSGLGLTYKHFTKKHQAFETTLDLNNLFAANNLNILVGGTYQFYFTIVRGLRLYTGLGASGGVYIGNYNDFYLNADAVVGIEFKFRRAPIAFSLDWNPKVKIIGKGNRFNGNGFGLGLKLAF